MPFLGDTDYLVQQQEEDEKKKKQALTLGGPPATPGAGVTDAPAIGTEAAKPVAAPTGGNLFAQMRAANLGNVRMAQQLAAGQEERGKTFQDFLAEKRTGLEAATKAGTTAAAPRVVGRVLGAPERASAADLAEFNRQLTAQYRGPGGFEEFAGPEAAARRAELLAEGDISDTGALREAIGGRGAGKQRLNIGLLSAGENRALLEQAYEDLELGTEAGIGEARTLGEELAEAGEETTRATREAAETGLESALERQERVGEQAVRRATGARSTIQRQTRSALRSGRAPTSLLRNLGISRTQWNQLQRDVADVKRGIYRPAKQNPLTGMSFAEIVNYYRTVSRENQATAIRRAKEAVAAGKHREVKGRYDPGRFDPRRLFRGDFSRITEAEALTPAQGARAQALERLAGEEVDPNIRYGGATAGRWDPNQLAKLRHEARVARA